MWIKKSLMLEGKIPTNSALTALEDKIPDVSGLFKQTDFNTKITEIEGKIADISNLI